MVWHQFGAKLLPELLLTYQLQLQERFWNFSLIKIEIQNIPFDENVFETTICNTDDNSFV